VSQAVRVAKTGAGFIDLRLEWDRAAGAVRYNIWRGRIDNLARGRYDHQIPFGLGPGRLCNVPELDPGNLPGVLNTRTLVGEAVALGTSAANFYYVVGAEAACPTGAAIDGPLGYADLDLDASPDAVEERPLGLLLDPGCIP
jgi:hypothetical protein